MNEQKINQIVERVLALRNMTKTTTMITARSQTALLAPLSEDELAEAALRIQRAEQ